MSRLALAHFAIDSAICTFHIQPSSNAVMCVLFATIANSIDHQHLHLHHLTTARHSHRKTTQTLPRSPTAVTAVERVHKRLQPYSSASETQKRLLTVVSPLPFHRPSRRESCTEALSSRTSHQAVLRKVRIAQSYLPFPTFPCQRWESTRSITHSCLLACRL